MGRIPETPGQGDGQMHQSGEQKALQPATRTGRVINWLEHQEVIFDNEIFGQIAERIRTGVEQVTNLYLETGGIITLDGKVKPYDGRNINGSGIRINVGRGTKTALRLAYKEDVVPTPENLKTLRRVKKPKPISIQKMIMKDGNLVPQSADTHVTAVASVFKAIYAEPGHEMLQPLATDLVPPDELAIKTLADIIDQASSENPQPQTY